MKVTRLYAINLNQVLIKADKEFAKPITGRFRYMVSANAEITEKERKLTMEAYPYDPKYVEFARREDAMRKELGLDDKAKAEAMTPEQRADADKKFKALEDEFKDAIAAENEIAPGRNEFLSEEIDLDLKTIRADDIPNIVADDDWYVWNMIRPLVKD